MSWSLDSAHTQVQFSVRHMMISKVRGEFQKVAGSVNLDETNPANTTLDIQIETSRIVAMSFCEPRSCIGRLSS